MFVLDTDIPCPIMLARPVPEVAAWIARIARQLEDTLITTVRRKSRLGLPSCRKAEAGLPMKHWPEPYGYG